MQQPRRILVGAERSAYFLAWRTRPERKKFQSLGGRTQSPHRQTQSRSGPAHKLGGLFFCFPYTHRGWEACSVSEVEFSDERLPRRTEGGRRQADDSTAVDSRRSR